MAKVLKPILLDETGKKISEAITSLSATQIPVGGKLGNVLTKNSDNDRDVVWKVPLKSYNDLENKPLINGKELTGEQTSEALNLQAKLRSGINIKTINDTELLGAGNIEIKGISDYNDLENKPSINGTPLKGDLSLDFGKVDDVKVNGSSVVTNKEASIDLSSYAEKTDLENYLPLTGTAAKATADANGNNIVNTYATKEYVDNLITAAITANY